MDAYLGPPQVLTYAYASGDIGSILLATAPIRKNKTPYVGCSVLDGTTTANDWVESKFIPTKELPRVSNPSKGYVIAANNRIGYENVKHDLGQTIVSSARA